MNFWIAILNSLPQTLAIAILTSVFTGILLYYFQRRINNSFEEKMEQYKTDLQKELIEHQLKFSKSYPRTVEILEKGYQKLRDLSQYFIGFSHQVLFVDQPFDYEEIRAKNKSVMEAVREFSEYFENNRLYLANELFTKINEIINAFENLGTASLSMWKYGNQSLASLKIKLTALPNLTGLSVVPLEETEELEEELRKQIWFLAYWNIIELKYNLLTQEYEQIYKSVSGG